MGMNLEEIEQRAKSGVPPGPAGAIHWQGRLAKSQDDNLSLASEVRRLRWLIEWVDSYGSFDKEQWSQWEKLQQAEAPWDEAEALGVGL